jgi:uncharacterized RDD family membrane protein YckC
LAGWWRRVGATVVDGIVIGVISGIILGIAGVSVTGWSRYFLEGVFQVVYQILLLGGNRGRTLGNRVVNTVTVDGRTGTPISYDRAIPRSLVQALLGFTIIGGVLDILWPLWDRQNQTLHDKAAGTVVLRTDVYR